MLKVGDKAPQFRTPFEWKRGLLDDFGKEGSCLVFSQSEHTGCTAEGVISGITTAIKARM